MHVIVDPASLAARRITVSELFAAIDRGNNNISGGDFNEGKRRYVVRTVGEYKTPEDIDSRDRSSFDSSAGEPGP